VNGKTSNVGKKTKKKSKKMTFDEKSHFGLIIELNVNNDRRGF
jgi:hypothetical protein